MWRQFHYIGIHGCFWPALQSAIGILWYIILCILVDSDC